MKIIVFDRNAENADVFRWRFGDIPQVEAHCGALESLPRYDCIATAGNSFGLMDAGLDLAIVRYFGRPLMEAIQARILRDYLGEQPVGTSFLVRTGMPERPFVAHTPTMRIPMNISGTDHVYVATWATLLAAAAHNRSGDPPAITTLALPGFGTGTGGVEILEASLQMRLAIEHFLKPPAFLNPTVAQERHERIHYGGRWGFLNPRPRADLVD